MSATTLTHADIAELPEEVQSLLRPHLEPDEDVLARIGTEIAAKRDEAKDARRSSGIEDYWRAAEEAYVGIDDANRSEYKDVNWAKPMAIQGPLTSNSSGVRDNKSTIFFRTTARYVDAGSAKLGEILLPADDKAFSFSETPVPELIDAADDDREIIHSQLGVPLTKPPEPVPGAPAPAEPEKLTVKDLANERIEAARKKAKAAEKRIYDWMVEGKYTAEARKLIFDAAKLGVGVIKGPAPELRKEMARKEGGKKIFFREKIIPVSKRVNPWNFFPDPACGEEVKNGSYTFERDYFSGRKVKEFKTQKGYIKSQIDKVLEEGPDKIKKDDQDRGLPSVQNKEQYEVWFFNGTLTKDEMEAIDFASGRTPLEYKDEVYAVITLINDHVVKADINPLESGELPYNTMPWQRRPEHWAGIGIAEQMRAPQKVINGAARAMMNNAGLSAGPQIIIDQRAVRPVDGEWDLAPLKLWTLTQDAPEDVSKIFTVVNITDTTESLERIIQLGERMAEETTSIPLITQGQSAPDTPDTFGGQQLQNNNANQLLRAIGYAYDDCITEPLVRRNYEWLLLDPDVPDEEKGDWQINAHGSVALVERAIQDQTLGQLGALVANPIYGKDPEKWADEYLRSKHLDPKRMSYTDEEKAKMKAAPAPEAPQVTAAKINADTQLKLGVMKQTADQQSLQSEQAIEQAAQALEGHRIQTDQHATVVDATVRLHEIQANAERTIEELKTALAKTAMALQTERDLNAANQAAEAGRHRVDKAVELHRHYNPQPKPAVQVPGRARNGQQSSQAGV